MRLRRNVQSAEGRKTMSTNKRTIKKIAKRLQEYDAILCSYFSDGGNRKHRESIRFLRSLILYHARRWPRAYREAFKSETDLVFGEISLGHYDAGR